MGYSTNAIIGFGYAIDTEESDIDIIDDWEDIHFDMSCDPAYEEFEFGTFCSNEFPMPYICLESRCIVALRGSVKKIQLPQIPESDIEKIKKLADELGYRKDNEEPYWFLVSYVG